MLNFNPYSERIKLASQRLAASYRREVVKDIEQVPIVEPMVNWPIHPVDETWKNLDKMLETAVLWANNLAATSNDWTPVIMGYCTVVMVPEAFGCQIIYPENQSPWAKHAIYDINQVWELKPKDFLDVPTIKRQIEWIDYFQHRLGVEVPMWTPDIQSPFSVAAQIVEPTELLIACVSDPKSVHHLCQMITDFTVEMTEHLFSKIEHPGFPGANFPSISENIGICLADDTPLIMLSPDMYREFAFPYNCIISEIFGGVHVHSCGDYRHNLNNLIEIPNICSIQLHAGEGEFVLPESIYEDCAFNQARKAIAYFVDVNDISRGDDYRGKHREFYSDYVIPRLCKDDLTGLILQSCGSDKPALGDVDFALSWTREQLKNTKQGQTITNL